MISISWWEKEREESYTLKNFFKEDFLFSNCRNDKDTSFNFWKKLKGYQTHRFSLKLTRHDAKEWEKTSAFLLKKFQNEARQQKKLFSFTKKFHFHTVLQSPLRKTKKTSRYPYKCSSGLIGHLGPHLGIFGRMGHFWALMLGKNLQGKISKG